MPERGTAPGRLKPLDVIESWLAGKTELLGEPAPLYIKAGVLYSYGPHFPLAWMQDGVARVNAGRTTHVTSRYRHALILSLRDKGVTSVLTTREDEGPAGEQRANTT